MMAICCMQIFEGSSHVNVSHVIHTLSFGPNTLEFRVHLIIIQGYNMTQEGHLNTISSQVVVEKKLMREKELTRHDLGCDKCISEPKAAAATKVAEGAAPRGKDVNHKSPAKAQKAKTSSLPANFFDSQGVKRQNDGTGFEGRSVRHEVAGVQPPIKEADAFSKYGKGEVKVMFDILGPDLIG